MIKIKSNLINYLVKTFFFALLAVVVLRFIESEFLGGVVVATYSIIILWPIVITFLVWYSERSSLKEIEVYDEGIQVTNNKGESFKMLWESVSSASYKPRKGVFSRSIWALSDKEGSKIYIHGGNLSYKDEDKLAELIRMHLSKCDEIVKSRHSGESRNPGIS